MKKTIFALLSTISLFIAVITFIGCKQETNKNDANVESSITNVTSKDPLPSWNDGELKNSIISFVKEATDSTLKNFIPKGDRIATFDNDGTLWAEKPLVQELFAFYQVKKMVAANPALASKQPFKAVVDKDMDYFKKGGEKALIELVIATHTGMTEDEFEKSAKDFMATQKYPGKNVPIKNITYQPQIELLNYLRANGFLTFICSGGTVELMRTISQDFYGIPKHQVIGTSFKYEFDETNRTIIRKPALNTFDDKAVKPTNIQLHIGQRPVFACGNVGAGGDVAMLKYSQSSSYPSFQLLVNHTDAEREYAYQEKDSVSLTAAKANKWHVIDMKKDWKKVFRD
jgi:hypothetical protein